MTMATFASRRNFVNISRVGMMDLRSGGKRIQVRGLPQLEPQKLKQKLIIYFQNHTLSGGGEVAEENSFVKENGTAVIGFEHEKDAYNVARRHGHEVAFGTDKSDKTPIEVTLLDELQDSGTNQMTGIGAASGGSSFSSKSYLDDQEYQDYLEWKKWKARGESLSTSSRESPPAYSSITEETVRPFVKQSQLKKEREYTARKQRLDESLGDDEETFTAEPVAEFHAIQIKNLPDIIHPDTLKLYFANKKSSGGGELVFDECNVDRTAKKAIIAFQSKEDRNRVLQQRHVLKNCKLVVEEAPPRLPLVPDQHCLLLRDFDPSTSVEELKLFAENHGKVGEDESEPLVVLSEDNMSAFIKFDEKKNITSVIKNVSKARELHGRKLKAQGVNKTSWIMIIDVPDELDEDDIKVHFNTKSYGGDDVVLDIQKDRDMEEVYVQFKTYEAFDAALQKDVVVVCGKELQVYPYYPSLNVRLAPSTPPKVPPPVEIEVYPYISDCAQQKPKCQEVFTNALSEHSVKLNWLTNKVELSCTLPTTVGKRAFKKWPAEVRVKFKEAQSKFGARQVEVPPEVWQCGVDEMFSNVTDCVTRLDKQNNTIAIGGMKEDVEDGYKMVSNIVDSIAREIEQKKAIVSVTEHLETWRHTLLKHKNFFSQMQEKYLKVEISSQMSGDSVILTIRGESEIVNKARSEILETTNRVARQSHKISPCCASFLKTPEAQQYFSKKFQEHDIDAITSTEAEVVWVYGKTDQHARKGLQMVKNMVAEATFPLDEASIIKETFEEFIRDLTENYNKLLQIQQIQFPREGGQQPILSIGTVQEIYPQVCQEVKRFLEDNQFTKTEVRLQRGEVKFVDQFLETKVRDFKRQHSVEVSQLPSSDGFVISGPKKTSQDVAKEFDDMVKSNMSTGKFECSRPNAKQYLKKGIGNDALMGLQAKSKCVIEMDDDDTGEIEHAQEAYDYEPQQTRVHAEFTYSQGRRLRVFTGELPAQEVDVIVNAANEKLQHEGGLAKAIVRAGGEEIQNESNAFIEKYSRSLFPGEIAVTRSGRLKCKRIIHAVSPLYSGSESGQEKMQLQGCVKKCLLKCEEGQFRSIAFPAIGSGSFNIPLKTSCYAIVEAVHAFWNENPNSCVRDIRLVDLNQGAVLLFTEAMNRYFGDRNVAVYTDSEGLGGYGGHDSLRFDSLDGADVERYVHTPRGVGLRQQSDLADESWTNEGVQISVVFGLIQSQQADVVVNTVNSSLALNHGGAATALANAAGPNLVRELERIAMDKEYNASAGEIFSTTGGHLACREVYHVVPSEYDFQKSGPATKVYHSLIYGICDKANTRKYSSIAMPTIGCGQMGYPPEVAASIMFEEIVRYSRTNPSTSLKHITIVLFPYDQETTVGFKEFIEKQGRTFADFSYGTRATEIPGLQQYDVVCSPVKMIKRGQHMSVTVEGKEGKIKLEVLQEDITKAKDVTCLVNPTNTALQLSVGGVSTAIMNMDKDGSVQQELNKHSMDLGQGKDPDDGEIFVTSGGKLSCSHILHVVISSHTDITKVVQGCLKEGEMRKTKSVAFPALGTGMSIDDKRLESQSAKVLMQSVVDGIAAFIQLDKPKFVKTVKVYIFLPRLWGAIEGALKDVAAKSDDDGSSKKGTGFFGTIASVFKTKKKNDPNPRQDVTSEKNGDLNLRESVVFSIYASSDENVEVVKVKLKEMMEQHFIWKNVEDPMISSFTDAERRHIKSDLEKKFKIQVTIDEYCGRVTLHGTEIQVAQGESELLKRMSEKESRKRDEESLERDCRWGFLHPFDFFHPFDRSLSYDIEHCAIQAKQAKEIHHAVKHRFSSGDHIYSVRFDETYRKGEFSQDTKHERSRTRTIYRKVTSSEIPVYWKNQSSSGCELVPLTGDCDQPEYEKMETLFLESIETVVPSHDGTSSTIPASQFKVEEITRIENSTLYKQFVAKKKKIQDDNPDLDEVERTLFHGTPSANCNDIANEGFNRSMAGDNVGAIHGRGVYFASTSATSAGDQYSPKDDNGFKYIIISYVLVGDFTETNDPNIKKAPIKEDGRAKFDSVVDKKDNPKSFVIFHDAQAYPAYIVKFKAPWT